MPNVYLPITATIFSTLLLIIYFSKKRIDLLENKLYTIMLVAVLIDSILSSMIFLNVYINYNKLFVEICNKIDYIQLIIWISCMFLYTYTITHGNEVNFKRNLKYIVYIMSIINVIVSILIFNADIDIILINIVRQTAQGEAVKIAYIIWGIYMIACGVVSLVNFKKINKKYIPIFISLILSIIVYIIFSINPFLIIISISLTFINLVMFFTIENPDLKMITQLNLAKDMAEKANNAKSDFLSSMSHEIRTPLNAIKGFSELIEDAQTLDEAKENAREVVKASNILLEIINGILDISKIESGKLELVLVNYNPNEMINDLVKLLSYRFEEKNLEFNVHIAPDLPNSLYGDVTSIRKIITNLLTNAAKYTSKGKVYFTINCINKGDISKLIISVEDTGRGIKEEQINKLFTKFNRLDEDKNTTTEGTGLGLAITKHLVELMEGRITVQSVYGSGSKFTVIIDQKIIKEEKEEKKEELKEKKEIVKIDLPNKKILLVDDNIMNIKIAKKLLSEYKCDIVESMNGQDVLNRINNAEKYDLILIDDMMPGMSGTDVMKKLKSDGYRVPIVVLTANAMDGHKEKYLNEGFDDYIGKPIERKELNRVINKYLK